MLVSWTWLARYLNLSITPEELGHRFAMSGLNLESIERVGDDTVIDLEVTSNRGDCLGHLGVAREASVLLHSPLCIPNPAPQAKGPDVHSLVQVENRFPEACPRYTARVIQGVKIGPSPDWLANALRTIGIGVVNNVVDITNYVLFECGQPLHAFDLAHVQSKRIVVRPAEVNETIEAIDHRSYALLPTDCVIADASRPLAIAGVMGGALSEVSLQTRDLLIESADFAPLSVRRTARRLKLHSPSSFRFERRVDPVGLDWASRRCCELILEIAGGTLASGMIESHPLPQPHPAIALRWSQIERILGIQVSQADVRRILQALGCQEQSSSVPERIAVVTPSWRHDLTREIDLIEEIARVHGYDKIPDNSPIPVVTSRRRPLDQAMDQVRLTLSASGFCEAMTPSVVTSTTDALYSPWTELPALEAVTPMLEGARTLRRTLLPSLIQSRYYNQSASGTEADLYELAHIYLPSSVADALPQEKNVLAWVSGKDFFVTKGLVETILERLGIQNTSRWIPHRAEIIDEDLAVEWLINETRFGFIGVMSDAARRKLKLDRPVTLCELDLDLLFSLAKLTPQHHPISPYPAVSRDINLIVDEATRWAELSTAVRHAVGAHLTDLRYVETYRDPKKDGEGKKRILMSMVLQKPDATLSGTEADSAVQLAVQRCERDFHAKLLM